MRNEHSTDATNLAPKDDELLSLAKAARLLPRAPHPSAVWRWALDGARTADGRRVFLEVERYGRRLYTTRRALREFGRALARAHVAARAGSTAIPDVADDAAEEPPPQLRPHHELHRHPAESPPQGSRTTPRGVTRK